MAATTEPLEVPDSGLISGEVRLRTWLDSDAAALAAAWADPAVARWTAVPGDRSVEAAQRWIAGGAARLDAALSVDLVVCAPADDAVRGEVGLAPIAWDRRAAQVGYWLLEAWRGRGLAAAALALLTHWATTELGLRMLVARCHPDNPASSAVAEHAGYGFERADQEGFRLHVYRSGSGSC